jgi:hypothetical protein
LLTVRQPSSVEPRQILSVRRRGVFDGQRRELLCLPFDLRADGYDAVSAVPNYLESLRLDLDLEVSVWFNLEDKLLCTGEHSSDAGIKLEINKIYGRDYPELNTKIP